jgi:hypothetical protein
MCGRYASHLADSEIAALFSTEGELANLVPNWNVARRGLLRSFGGTLRPGSGA